jgi:hypothetical protein
LFFETTANPDYEDIFINTTPEMSILETTPGLPFIETTRPIYDLFESTQPSMDLFETTSSSELFFSNILFSDNNSEITNRNYIKIV